MDLEELRFRTFFSFSLGFHDCLASNFDEIFIEPKWVQPIITSPRSIVLPKNGPYTATFDKFIVRAYDTGLFHKAKYQYQFRDGKYLKYFPNHLDLSTFFSRCNW